MTTTSQDSSKVIEDLRKWTPDALKKIDPETAFQVYAKIEAVRQAAQRDNAMLRSIRAQLEVPLHKYYEMCENDSTKTRNLAMACKDLPVRGVLKMAYESPWYCTQDEFKKNCALYTIRILKLVHKCVSPTSVPEIWAKFVEDLIGVIQKNSSKVPEFVTRSVENMLQVVTAPMDELLDISGNEDEDEFEKQEAAFAQKVADEPNPSKRIEMIAFSFREAFRQERMPRLKLDIPTSRKKTSRSTPVKLDDGSQQPRKRGRASFLPS